jgi:hypothetical protein
MENPIAMCSVSSVILNVDNDRRTEKRQCRYNLEEESTEDDQPTDEKVRPLYPEHMFFQRARLLLPVVGVFTGSVSVPALSERKKADSDSVRPRRGVTWTV